jgi:hypothetical protein
MAELEVESRKKMAARGSGKVACSSQGRGGYLKQNRRPGQRVWRTGVIVLQQDCGGIGSD